MLKETFNHLKRRIQETRGRLEYSEGVGITALLYCPLKWELEKKYPQKPEEINVEIFDGFVWELLVKKALKERYGIIEEEKVLLYRFDDIPFTVEGHLDVFIPSERIGIELKNVRITPVHFPVDNDIDEILEKDHPLNGAVEIPSHYLDQAKLQLFFLRKEFPDAKLLLWVKTTLRGSNGRTKKVIVEKEVVKPFDERTVREFIERFLKEKGPRFDWECRYCRFSSVCPRR